MRTHAVHALCPWCGRCAVKGLCMQCHMRIFKPSNAGIPMLYAEKVK